MIEYHFVCEKCETNTLLTQSITADLPTHCPMCGASEAFHQVYSGDQFTVVQKEPTTFGQQAERNAKRVGKEQIDRMAVAAKEANHKGKSAIKTPKGSTPMNDRYKAARPWWRPHSDKPLDVGKLKNPEKFVATGKDG